MNEFKFLPGAQSGKTSSGKKKIILFCQGGAGDVLAQTPMIRYFRKKYPEDYIIVACTYADLLRYNSNIDEVWQLNDNGGLYEEYMAHDLKNVRFYKKHFLYDAFLDESRHASKCLPEFACKVYGAEYDEKDLDYFITEKEAEQASYFLAQFKKPVILLHVCCAIPSENPSTAVKVHYHKDIPIDHLVPFIDAHKEKFDFAQIGLIGEPVIPNAIDCLGMRMREVIPIISLAHSFIFIESLFAHCANALHKRGVVVCNNMDSSFFGHPNAINITDGGGCEWHPCNRPLGSLSDITEHFLNPKTRERSLWKCANQTCNKIPLNTLESAFFKVLEDIKQIEVIKKKNEKLKTGPSLDDARKQQPKKTIPSNDLELRSIPEVTTAGVTKIPKVKQEPHTPEQRKIIEDTEAQRFNI